MNKTLLQWQEVEVTSEEEEAWQNFLTKYNDNPPKKENIETTIPMEKKDGVQ